MSRVSAAVVGEAGDRILYIVITKDDVPVKNGLFKLQHPGMLAVESWNSEVVKQSDDGIKMNTVVRTKKFFSDCVFPVSEAVIPLEETLIDKYGRNAGGKLKPDSIPPKYSSVWNRVSSRFLDGELWNDLPESGEDADGSTAAEGGG